MVWDVLLILAVTGMVLVMAVIRAPHRKALVLTVPVPFTLASFAVAEPVGVSHVAALPLLFGYTVVTWWLHRRKGVPVVLAAAVSATGYVAIGALARPHLPASDAWFWTVLAFVLVLGVALRSALPELGEQPRPDPLPLARKVPIVVTVVVLLVLVKEAIGGFMTLFPMVGVLASWENREGLWSNVAKIPIVMITMVPLMATARVLEPSVGSHAAILMGWIPFLVALAPFVFSEWRGVSAA